ncbi:D-alanine--D-alanine ligase [Helicobacter jaachi]|uniref:D-alanine--D-alanine ligase n=1 Tax=Helicobacter jaachi TaxID=1677920 RepID=A0A4U8TBB9_9HELI|nr:D-alanine--D-alanine ligase [Helicobacter jaachi]TLD96974.1 D-alanine--D-alanine ligase [Helicobacter jaachi]
MKFDILFGGLSFEHEISIVSAIALKKVLGDRICHFIFLDSAHRFYLIPADSMKSTFFSAGDYKKCVELFTHRGAFVKKTLFGFKAIVPNTIINLIHGADGEDGTISALLDFYGLHFIGPRIESSVMSFNKALTKLYAQSRGVNVLPYELLTREHREIKHLSYPLILKPARLGSSIGVSVVNDSAQLDYAMDLAFEYDDCIVVEGFRSGVKEYNLAGCKLAGGFEYSIIEEPSKKELLDFEHKYLDFSRTAQVLKADISSELEAKLQACFARLYENAFEGALIRCDFFVIDDEVYLNEINPIPGSMANYLFADFAGVITDLAHNLPKKHSIKVSYKYIEQIHHAKGK